MLINEHHAFPMFSPSRCLKTPKRLPNRPEALSLHSLDATSRVWLDLEAVCARQCWFASAGMDVENNIRYVAVGNPTGWAGIAKTIRDVDEDKIKDHKEDIDTLLVFTGLFSAVLTAFVIESYQSLSPDPMAPVIHLLGRIADQTQSYTISSNTINSTFRPDPLHVARAFEPPLSAVRVNQLWFASLAITLITASFAMLVKQWLREYLAMDYTSPHERLRARQFRHPGLAAWKVFEIAGLLPLLLQLALGLFFLGMCIFTWTVNSGVGKGSTVLVGGWLFLFTGATLAPVVSPRCPYKMFLLKNIMIKVRRGIRWLWYPPSIRRGVQAMAHVISLGQVELGTAHAGLSSRQYDVEEFEALKQDIDELNILKEVDEFLLDDDLLATTIFDSLMQYHTDPSTIVKFVLQSLNLRLKGTELTQPLTSTPDLRRLTKRGWMAVSDIVANTVLHAFASQVSGVGRWFEDAIYLLSSHSDQPLTPAASKALVHCIQRSTLSRFTTLLASLAAPPDHVIHRLYEIWEPFSARLRDVARSPNTIPSDMISLILQLYALGANSKTPILPLQSTLDLQHLPRQLALCGSDVIATALLSQLDAAGENAIIGPWFSDALYCLLTPSSHPLPANARTALSRCIRKQTIVPFGDALGSLTSFSSAIMPVLHDISGSLSARFIELINTSDLPPSDVVSFVLRLYSFELDNGETHVPLQSLLSLELLTASTWNFGSDVVGTIILRTLETANDVISIGPWLEDAIKVLLSSCQHPLTTISTKALAKLCEGDTCHDRFGKSVRMLASLDSSSHRHVLTRFGRIFKCISASSDANWLLRELLLSVPCSSRCTHQTMGSSMALLFYDHVGDHEDWARCYTSLLIGRLEGVTGGSGSWPPGSSDSYRALLSCPIPLHRLHDDAFEVIFNVLANSGPPALYDLVTVEEGRRGWTKIDVAIGHIVSLLAEVSGDDRRSFFDARSSHCHDYATDPSCQYYACVGLNVDSIFPDKLFEQLASFLSDEIANRFKRIRRLKVNGAGQESTSLATSTIETTTASDNVSHGHSFDEDLPLDDDHNGSGSSRGEPVTSCDDGRATASRVQGGLTPFERHDTVNDDDDCNECATLRADGARRTGDFTRPGISYTPEDAELANSDSSDTHV
ncbi:hypothetical protein NM688_g5540 [Phlebia brevispora]|uniref:Uncharacterized protein n=1 Tax=Phlebia brevispora TaxID=194682 RepID=A0ACC1STS4_9APHY|nr:hypothetical protein NM688_g5540 [Phlebia brevispora]